MSLLASYDQYESGKRAERLMQIGIDTGIYGSSYNQIAKENIEMINTTSGTITFFGLVTSVMTGLIGICFISMDKSIEQLQRKAD
jgi:hypothetical protein